jgi:cytochrome P450
MDQLQQTPVLSIGTATLPPADEPVSHVDLGIFCQDLLHGILELHAKHGPIAAVQDGQLRAVVIFSPELNQQVLSDTTRYHARFFAVRGPKNSAQRRLTCGLLSMNGEQHRRNRRVVKEPFGRAAIATYGETITRVTDEMLAKWQIGDVRDLAEEMRRYMLQVTSTILFGLDEPEVAYRLGDMIADWVSLNDAVGAGALVPNEVFSNRYEELLAFAERLEGAMLELIRFRRESGQYGRDVLSILVRSHDEEGGLSDEELVGQASVLFAAAHMTTAHALTWTQFLLAEHPSVMRKLWAELQSDGSVTGASDLDSGAAGENAEDNGTAESKTLLERVIKESMRILPASAYSQRVNNEAVDLGPLHLPRGTGIIFTPLVTHRLPEIYPEPKRFLPDRWLELRPSPYAYHPFGAGARLCIGGPLALGVIRIALRRILSRFRLQVVPGAEISAHVESTMLMPTNGVIVRICPADGAFESSPIEGNIHELVDLVEVPAFAAGVDVDRADARNGSDAMPRRPR